jgi:hypothetical protein
VVHRHDEEGERTRRAVVDRDPEFSRADDGDLHLRVARYAVRVALVGEVADGYG